MTRIIFLLLFGGLLWSVGNTAYIEYYRNGIFPLPHRSFLLLLLQTSVLIVLLRSENMCGIVTPSVLFRNLLLCWTIWTVAFGIAILVRPFFSFSLSLAIILGVVLITSLTIDLFKGRA